MLRSLEELVGYAIGATDGELGSLDDFLFHDATWRIWYAVVDTRRWLPGRKVLLWPGVLEDPATGDARVIPTSLDQEQVRESPPLEEHQAVSWAYHQELVEHYRWQDLWEDSRPGGEGGGREAGDPRLRAFLEIQEDTVEAVEGPVGRVQDIIADTQSWTARYIVADLDATSMRKQVLLSTAWIAKVLPAEGRVRLDLPRQVLEASPPFDPGQPVNRALEVKLFDYYGRPVYWE